ncbi:hypothetical protein CDL12_02741 [Handroanthus impetiginosus]|uniref:Uncharacterized protein n=1 Tax=Handroanthus impetiginosus TaxID=429701 RepID=A0A2G9I447_9LAMI|nr:hypothetical protein CDL12_02741 [Handroanthus impetiginosus]
MMQFSGECGARYFDPNEAHKRIHKGDSAHWTYNMITKNQNLLFTDDGKAKELEQDYFISIRSNYLPLRQEKKLFNHFEESSIDRHWKRLKRDSKTSKQTEADGDETRSNRTQAFAKKLEKEILGIDDDKESQDSQESTTRPNSYTPVAMKVNKEIVDSPKIKELPQFVDVSIFEREKLVLYNQKKFPQMLWVDLCRKISNTPIDSISSVHDEVQIVLTSMKSFDKFDISHLEERLKALFDKAAAYDNARSSYLSKTSKELLAQQMKEAKDRLHEACIKESKAEEELNDLEECKRNLIALLNQQQQILQSVQAEIREIEEEVTAIENTSSLSDEAAENLNTAMKQVEVAKEKLETLRSFI